MSDIAWTPDENGVPMCDCAECDRADECPHSAHWHGDAPVCYPALAKIVAALKLLLPEAANAIPCDVDQMEIAINAAEEALNNE